MPTLILSFPVSGNFIAPSLLLSSGVYTGAADALGQHDLKRWRDGVLMLPWGAMSAWMDGTSELSGTCTPPRGERLAGTPEWSCSF
jgi:hypothetical protein